MIARPVPGSSDGVKAESQPNMHIEARTGEPSGLPSARLDVAEGDDSPALGTFHTGR